MTNLDSILKSRDITLSTKVCLVKVMVFPVVMCGCQSWTIKKAECQKIDAFELWCWRRLLRVPWTARRSNQSILKEICPEYSLEGLMLKLKLQYFGHLIWGADSLEKTYAGRDWGQEEKGKTEDEMVGWHHWLNGHGFGWTPGVGDGQGGLVCWGSWGHKESDMTEWLNWKRVKSGRKKREHLGQVSALQGAVSEDTPINFCWLLSEVLASREMGNVWNCYWEYNQGSIHMKQKWTTDTIQAVSSLPSTA